MGLGAQIQWVLAPDEEMLEFKVTKTTDAAGAATLDLEPAIFAGARIVGLRQVGGSNAGKATPRNAGNAMYTPVEPTFYVKSNTDDPVPCSFWYTKGTNPQLIWAGLSVSTSHDFYIMRVVKRDRCASE